MLKKKTIITISILIFINISGFSQSIEAQFNSLVGSKDKLPFWLWANQLGKYDSNNSTIQNFNFAINYDHSFDNSEFNIETKACIDALIGDDSNIQITELYGGINWKFLQIKTGAFAEPKLYDGLSASNGNLAYSRNARPHPKIRLGFNQFVPIIKNTLSIHGFWEEGLLNDDRYVADTRLHHKALHFRLGAPQNIEVTFGVEHYVMWAGTHPTYGELSGWSDYFDYVTGSSGDEDALMTDQINVVGNGYGTYQVGIKKDWNQVKTTFYISHPYDDKSGMELENIKDNLYGLFLSFNKETPLIKSIVLEYYHTLHQSGSYHLKTQPDGSKSGRGVDDYYNHGIYQSGVTYHQIAMTSPLFGPIRYEDEISVGFENTRFSGIHIGSSGYLSENFHWRALTTLTNNKGRYKSDETTSFDPSRKQFASLVQIYWSKRNFPLNIGCSFAFDHGNLYDDGQSTSRLGTMFSVGWKIKE